MFELAIALVIFLIIIAIFIGWIYRNLDKKKAFVDVKWNYIEANLKKRANLVPGLISTVDKFVDNELLITESLKQSRMLILNAGHVNEYSQANNQLTDDLNKLFEANKECSSLNNDDDYIDLMNKFLKTEKNIDDARIEYNEAVLDFNNKCQDFPYFIFVDVLGFKERDYFKGYPEFNENTLKFEF